MCVCRGNNQLTAHILSDPQAQQSVFSVHTKQSAWVPGAPRHTRDRSGLWRSQGWPGLGWQQQQQKQPWWQPQPWKKERKLLSLMLGPVVRGQLSHSSLQPGAVTSAQILTLQPEGWERDHLCSASKHFSRLLQKKSVILWVIIRYIIGLHPHFRHRAPQTLGIS